MLPSSTTYMAGWCFHLWRRNGSSEDEGEAMSGNKKFLKRAAVKLWSSGASACGLEPNTEAWVQQTLGSDKTMSIFYSQKRMGPGAGTQVHVFMSASHQHLLLRLSVSN